MSENPVAVTFAEQAKQRIFTRDPHAAPIPDISAKVFELEAAGSGAACRSRSTRS